MKSKSKKQKFKESAEKQNDMINAKLELAIATILEMRNVAWKEVNESEYDDPSLCAFAVAENLDLVLSRLGVNPNGNQR
jgi:hypothetical protein